MCNNNQQALLQRRRRITDSTYNNGVDFRLIREWQGGDEIEVIQWPKRPRRFEEVR